MKILIIKLAAIGDVVLALPSFKAIREKYPRARITLLVGRWAAEAVSANPNIDQLMVIDENIFWQKKLWPLGKLFWQLKKSGFEYVYVMHWSKFFYIFAWLLGIPNRIGFVRKNETGIFLTEKIEFAEGSKEYHSVDNYLRLVTERWQKQEKKPDLYLSPEEKSWAKTILEKEGLRTLGIIAIVPGGGRNPKRFMPAKQWPIAGYNELMIRILAKTNYAVILLGSPAEAVLKSLINPALLAEARIKDFVGKLTLRQSAALISLSRVVICGDTGLLHIAGAVATPVLSLFGPTSPADKIPLDHKSVYIYKAVSCSPCYKDGHFPQCAKVDCMNAIGVEEVFIKLKEMLRI